MAEAVILLAVKKIGFALCDELVNQASSRFKKFVTQLAELQGSMGRIERELLLMHGFLCRVDLRNRNSQAYEVWLVLVRKLAHGIEDIVDEYLYLVGQKRDAGWRFYLKKGYKQPMALLSLNRIASMVKEAEVNLLHLFQAKDRWVPMAGGVDTDGTNYIVERSHDLATTSRHISEKYLVGIDENRNKLEQFLGNNKIERCILVVNGLGGTGKTTLAANVYQREQKKFDCHAWVTVSQTYDKRAVLRSLIGELFGQKKQAKPEGIGDMDSPHLESTVKEFLGTNKYFIVLDDVWNPEDFRALSEVFPTHSNGSRIIITTRNGDVAALASEGSILTLEKLSEGDSLKLLCRKALSSETNQECPEELKYVSKEIVRKCNYLPLAIVSVGGLLSVREKTVDEWKRIVHQINWEIKHNPRLEDVRNVLNLSFIYLPTYLKSCFLYCCLFPEDYLFRRKMLIRLWVAEGFIEKRGESTLEEVAEDYLKELIHRNLLKLVERNSFGRIRFFRVHDIIRELGVDLCQKECFGVACMEDKYHYIENGVRRLAVYQFQEETSFPSSVKHLRSIISFGNTKPSSLLLCSMLERSKYLSVLELRGLPITEVPESIGELFNLRYLGLRDSKVACLPNCIRKLLNLLTLDLSRSNIKELPQGISGLKKLRHLFADKVNNPFWGEFQSRIGVPIPRGLGNLTELQSLHAIKAQEGALCHLADLRQLRSLRILNMKTVYCEQLCNSLHNLKFLSALAVCASDENEVLDLANWDRPPLKLQKLFLTGKLPRGILESPLMKKTAKYVSILHLDWSRLSESPLEALSTFPNLSQLFLYKAYNGNELVFRTGWFLKLKTLYLRDLPNLEHVEIEEGAMPNLEKFFFVTLDNMTEVPTGIESLKTLEQLLFGDITPRFLTTLQECTRIENISWEYSVQQSSHQQ